MSHIGEREGLRGRGLTAGEWLIFVASVYLVGWALGMANRYPILDEVFVIDAVDRFDLGEIVRHFTAGWERHGPVSHVLYEVGTYIVSGRQLWMIPLLLSALAFGLILDLTLRAIGPVSPVVRLPILGAFLLLPSLHGSGDAVRWYPPFAFLVALFAWLYLREGAVDWRAGIALGLAASTDPTAIVVYAAFVLHRYAMGRRVNRGDVWFHLSLFVFALPGIVNFLRLRGGDLPSSGSNPLVRLVQSTIGLLGGMRLAIPTAAFLVPLFIVLAWGLWASFDSRPSLAPLARRLVEFTVVLGGLTVLLVASFAPIAGRYYLFLAPLVVAASVIGWQRVVVGRPIATALIGIAYVVAFAAFGANFSNSDNPLFRDHAVPYGTATAFVVANAQGSTLVVSADLVASYDLRDSGLCVVEGRFDAERVRDSPLFLPPFPECYSGDPLEYDTVAIIEGASGFTFNDVPSVVSVAEVARSKLDVVSTAAFGRDSDPPSDHPAAPGEPAWLMKVTILRPGAGAAEASALGSLARRA